MIDIFGSKVLSKLKKKDRKQPDCSQERGFWTKKYLPNWYNFPGPTVRSIDPYIKGHVQFEVGNYIYLVGGYIDHYRLDFDDHDQQYVKLRDVWR